MKYAPNFSALKNTREDSDPTLKGKYLLTSFSPSSGVGFYKSGEGIFQFDVVINEDFALQDEANLAALRLEFDQVEAGLYFNSLGDLKKCVEKEYLRHRKNTYYAALFSQPLSKNMRLKTLRLLNDQGLRNISLPDPLIPILKEIAKPDLVLTAIRHAHTLKLEHVQECLFNDLRDITLIPEVISKIRRIDLLHRCGQSMNRWVLENAVIAEIAHILTTTQDIEDVYSRFVKQVRKLLPFDRISISLIGPQDNNTVTSYYTGEDLDNLLSWNVSSLSGSFIEEVVRTRSSRIVQGAAIHEFLSRLPLLFAFQLSLQSSIIVPLLAKGEIVGALSLLSTRPIAYKDSDLKLIKRIGDQVAGSIAVVQLLTENKRLVEDKSLSEKQFVQSQRMEAVSQLTGGIAHEFNNILAAIRGLSDLSLHQIIEDDPLRISIDLIQKEVTRGANLIKELLTFSRMEFHELRTIDLNTIVKEVSSILNEVIGKDIEMETVLEENLGRVKANTEQINQTLINLALNAKDAMPRGGKITIKTSNVVLDDKYARTHAEVTPGPYVMLSVSDTGVGISPGVREQIFEPFFTTKQKRTGLGLSIVYTTVKNSSGNISVESGLGRGTTFRIYLPRAD